VELYGAQNYPRELLDTRNEYQPHAKEQPTHQ
jgi:hypothetical protein